MQFVPGVPVESLKEAYAKNRVLLRKLTAQYEAFKRTLEGIGRLEGTEPLPLTDFHEGNVLAHYSRKRGRFIFTVIDQ